MSHTVYSLQLFHVTIWRYWANQGTCVVPNDVMSLLISLFLNLWIRYLHILNNQFGAVSDNSAPVTPWPLFSLIR